MSIQTLIRAHNDVIARIDRRLSQLVDRLRWTDSVNRLQSIPGIGTLSGIALTAAYHRGVFASVDAFIAFLGLDVRVSDSGLSKGKRKLTKKGEPELRRLLYCAVTAATLTHPPFKTYLLSLRARGQSTIGSRCALARKLARTAFALLRNGQTFSPAEA